MFKTKVQSGYQGSDKTYQMVAKQIRERWGEKEVKNYDPYTNCLTFSQWEKEGYRVKKGARALQSITYVEAKNQAGDVINTYPKTINLFYFLDVEAIEPFKIRNVMASPRDCIRTDELRDNQEEEMITPKQKGFLTSLMMSKIEDEREKQRRLDNTICIYFWNCNFMGFYFA